MFVGSTGTPPFSGTGYELSANETLDFNVNTIDVCRVCATTSGQKLSYIWTQF